MSQNEELRAQIKQCDDEIETAVLRAQLKDRQAKLRHERLRSNVLVKLFGELADGLDRAVYMARHDNQRRDSKH